MSEFKHKQKIDHKNLIQNNREHDNIHLERSNYAKHEVQKESTHRQAYTKTNKK